MLHPYRRDSTKKVAIFSVLAGMNAWELKHKTPEQIEHYFRYAPIKGIRSYRALLKLLDEVDDSLPHPKTMLIQFDMSFRLHLAQCDDAELTRLGVTRLRP